jgi:hypothetical protein
VERYPRAKLATLKIRMDLLSYRLYCSEQEHPKRRALGDGTSENAQERVKYENTVFSAKLANTTKTVVSLNSCLLSSGADTIYSISTTRCLRQSPANGKPILSSKGQADVPNLTILTNTTLHSVLTRHRRRSRTVGTSTQGLPQF